MQKRNDSFSCFAKMTEIRPELTLLPARVSLTLGLTLVNGGRGEPILSPYRAYLGPPTALLTVNIRPVISVIAFKLSPQQDSDFITCQGLSCH
jgi:hypothetical protein